MGEEMNKYIKIICTVILTMAIRPMYGDVQMCAANNSVAVVLDPSIAPSSYTYDNTLAVWRTPSTYGTLVGVSACLSHNKNGSESSSTTLSTYAVSTANYGILTDGGVEVTGGEQNGKHCWCKITHPVASLWGFRGSYGSLSDCLSACATYCGSNVQAYDTFRSALFGSVAN